MEEIGGTPEFTEPKLVQEEQGVKKEPEILTEIQYLRGQENKTAFLPLLKSLPIKHAFSWGKDSRNMSIKYRGEEPEAAVRERVDKFLGDNGMPYYEVTKEGIRYPHVIHMIGAFEGTHLQTHEVLGDELEQAKDEVLIQANFVFTRNPEVILVIRPADCTVSIVYAKDSGGKDILAFIHSSAQSANAGLPRHAIRYLVDVLRCDPSTIKIGMTPGVSQENYTITQDDQLVDDPANPGAKKIINRPSIVERNWKDNISKKQTDDPSEERHVDIMSATVMQFIEEGIDPMNIQAYDTDSYTAAGRGEAFSHRYTTQKGTEHVGTRLGRLMVAAQLKS